MKKRFPSALIPLLGLICWHCGGPAAHDSELQALLDTDREFSQYSVDHGAAEAFRKYLLEDALSLPAGRFPVRGREKIYSGMLGGDTSLTLRWEPQEGGVAVSADVGYTWGIYTLTGRVGGGDSVISRGKYLNVWKRDPLGNWRVLIDTGNPNPEAEP